MPAKLGEFEYDGDMLQWLFGPDLLESQRLFCFATEPDVALASGVGSGKTAILCARALLLSWVTPGNMGLIGRDTYANLVDSTKKDFFEICPPQMIVQEVKSENKLVLRTCDPNKTSTIIFRYIQSTSPGRRHLSGLNLGFVAVDQLEDVTKDEWDYLHTRLRRRSVPYRCRFGILNANGHDWVYSDYFEPALKAGRVTTRLVPGRLGKPAEVTEYRAQQDRYALTTWTEENVHLPDGFIEGILKTQTREYIERYLYASFDEWGGKIYKGFSYNSKHVIRPFNIPADWPTIVSIDVGGDSPWAILTGRRDPLFGDVFITNEFYQPTVLVREIAAYLHDPERSGIQSADKADFICDPENKSAMLELVYKGIFCQAARKGPKVPGIMRVAGYLNPKPGRRRMIPGQPLPNGSVGDLWVEDAPHLWFFNRCENAIREHSSWQWKRDARTGLASNKPTDSDDHTCDANIYLHRILPDVRELPQMDEQLEALRKRDYYSYVVMKQVKEMRRPPGGDSSLGEMWSNEVGGVDDLYPGKVSEIW